MKIRLLRVAILTLLFISSLVMANNVGNLLKGVNTDNGLIREVMLGDGTKCVYLYSGAYNGVGGITCDWKKQSTECSLSEK